MKTIPIYIAFLGSFALLWSGCKKVAPGVYSGKTYAEFYNNTTSYELIQSTSDFYYKDPSILTDTVYLRIKTLGTIPTKTSYVRFRAYNNPLVGAKYPDAIAGKHYVPFTDTGLQALWKVEAGKYEAYLPIVLLRDPSLKNQAYQLTFSITDSEDILAGNPKHIDATIVISDLLSQPSNWSNTFFFLGTYGKVKHQFMIDQSGKKWDAAFINTILNDYDLQAYYVYKFSEALKTLNAERMAAGLTELREDPNSAATAVTFPN